MDESKQSLRACIVLYADEFAADVWETYCGICNVPLDSTEIEINFDVGDATGTRRDEKEEW